MRMEQIYAEMKKQSMSGPAAMAEPEADHFVGLMRDAVDELAKIKAAAAGANETDRRRFEAARSVLQGFCANPHVWEEWTLDELAERALYQADALLAGLDTPEKSEATP